MDVSRPHTRAATRDGVYASLEPLFRPARASSPLSSVESGDERSEVIGDHKSRGSVAPLGAWSQPLLPQASRRSEPSGEDYSSASRGTGNPLCVRSENFHLSDPQQDLDDGSWTPVTRRTSRTQRERSSSSRSKSTAGEVSGTESESIVAQATENMSRDELIALAHRHQFYAAHTGCSP
ncbi:hypothetical protein C8R47DRAFT_1081205 [Mycena vitilis]|nr:hypothetical protein C8R47DRAFT_1081205 [Mycena vitilis]